MVYMGPAAGRCSGESLLEFSSGSLYFPSGMLSKVLMGKIILEVQNWHLGCDCQAILRTQFR